MDRLSLIGLLIAFGGILGGQLLEGGSVDILFQGAAFLIVCGGTLGAVMLQSSFKVFITGIKMGRWVFVHAEGIPTKAGVPDYCLEQHRAQRRDIGTGVSSCDKP